jgi:hypothetical protein
MNELDERAKEAFETWVNYHYGSIQNFKYCCDTGAIEKGFMAGFLMAQRIEINTSELEEKLSSGEK